MRVTLVFGRIGAEVTIPSHTDARVLEAKYAQALCKDLPAGLKVTRTVCLLSNPCVG